MESSIASEFEKYPLPDDLDEDTLREFVEELQDIAISYAKNVDNEHFNIDWENIAIPQEINHKIPDTSLSLLEMKEFLENKLVPHFISTGSKKFLGYIPSDPLPESIAFASLTPMFNQFVGSVQGSPGGTIIEALVIRWIASLLNFPETSFGSFTSGGSMANLTAIYSGLVHQLKEYGIDLKEDGLIGSRRPIIYISDQTHNAIEKAIHMLGLGRKSIHKIKSNSNFQLTAEIVEEVIQKDLNDDSLLPVMIVATSGTTNTGSIDDLTGLREVADKYGLWLHIDGAYGAFSSITDHPITHELQGLSEADSIALDCHKWLYTPFEAGLTVIRDHKILRSAFDLSAEYLQDSELEEKNPLQRNFRSYGFPLTRELRGLKVWATISRMGLEGIKIAITRDILKADYLREKIEEHQQFELLHQGYTSIVCFRYKGTEQENINILEQLQSRNRFFLSTTKLRGETVLRVCFINRRSDLQTVEEFLGELNTVCQKLHLT